MFFKLYVTFHVRRGNRVVNHKNTFHKIRNFLAGRFIGATRDRALLEEVVKCLFIKVYLLREENKTNVPADPLELSKKYREVFSILKKELPSIFNKDDEVQLDPASIAFVDQEISNIELNNTKRDPFGDLYEVFIGTGIREEEGQFFTPQNGIELLISIINPQPGEKIIDPASGAGGFLSPSIQHLLDRGASFKDAISSVVGIEKDSYLAKLAATRLSLMSLLSSNVFCGDSLSWIDEKGETLPIQSEGIFDIVFTNPPFGKNIVSSSKEVQKTFDLGHEWKFNPELNEYEQNDKLLANVPPQVLFVERCVKLLKPGGRMGIVVPESLITSKSYRHVVQYLRKNGYIETVMGMPEDFFKTSGKGGTHTKACLITFKKLNKSEKIKQDKYIFMAEAKWCGHDSRGKNIEQDDLPLIRDKYSQHLSKQDIIGDHIGYLLKGTEIESNALSPRYYNPEVKDSLETIQKTHDIVKLGDLVEEGVLEIKTGHEAGKQAYGTGIIPFVRTSDLSNWEIKIDPKHGISEEIYEKYKSRQDVQEGDILMVKDGTYLIGTCAIITKYDKRIMYQSHLYKIRVKDRSRISPYLLLAILSSDLVQQQIKAKRFTQDIIDSLGSRIYELILPIPKDKKLSKNVENTVEKAINDRIEARELSRRACLEVAGFFN